MSSSGKSEEPKPLLTCLETMKRKSHTYDNLPPQMCTSTLVQKIDAPIALVWSVLCRFDNPQAYKQFIKSCTLTAGDGGPGSVREVAMVSGLPSKRSVERLEEIDGDSHIIVFSVIGGDQRLENFRSTTTLHEDHDDRNNPTVVMESYVVDVPWDSNPTDTCDVVDFVIKTNLTNLARIVEKMAAVDPKGDGSFSTVYLATETSCFSSSSISPVTLAVKAVQLKFSDSLKRESRILHKLKGNPYVVECYGVDISSEGSDGPMYNLLMELANGSLTNLIKLYKGNLPEFDVAYYTFMLLKGLSFIHQQGVIHCDVKPDNVLVFNDEEGRSRFLKLADFGLSKSNSDVPINGFRGTPHYAAPESVEQEIQDTPADIWSLGCTVIQMMNGGNPIWKDRNRWELENIPDHISPIGKDFLMRCLAFDPNSRWTADELLNHPFIQDNLRESIPALEFMQSEFCNNNPLSGSWSMTRGLFSPMQGIPMPSNHQSCHQVSTRIPAQVN
ncbi:OLC1v1021306C1 [Oldenlandia corymbosa var. corymbosa]|uniref:OLC1v1021306C1 n=1 Tax=Oldenlandia corymbosa var. corymbosa TaxID=529605 RepID=A0AAV1BZ00_OLDCO|nr:OLC1v1021306C1 [Oldenlandia corymbosa var. corymbosa]